MLTAEMVLAARCAEGVSSYRQQDMGLLKVFAERWAEGVSPYRQQGVRFTKEPHEAWAVSAAAMPPTCAGSLRRCSRPTLRQDVQPMHRAAVLTLNKMYVCRTSKTPCSTQQSHPCCDVRAGCTHQSFPCQCARTERHRA